jgi:hypothetical protein
MFSEPDITGHSPTVPYEEEHCDVIDVRTRYELRRIRDTSTLI